VRTRLAALWPRVMTGVRRGGRSLGSAVKQSLTTLLWCGWWLLTLPVRLLRGWARDAWVGFQRRGYLLIATLVAAYVGLYSVMEARHERQANRALFERANFMTMVASGHRGAFIAAMKTFGPVQTMTVPRDPELLAPWTWFAQERPNEEPLHLWVRAFFPLCTMETCGQPDPGKAWRIDLTRADLRQAKLGGARLMGADLRRANLIGADLRGTNLTGTDLRDVVSLTQQQLDTACVDDATQLPDALTRPAPCLPPP
jgi:hypothetical protein